MAFCIKKDRLLPVVFLLLVVLPPLFSIFFGTLHLKLPSYLFSIILTIVIILIGLEKKIVLSFTLPKFMFFLFLIWLIIGTQYGPSKIASAEKQLNIIYMILIPVVLIELLFTFTAISRNFSNINSIEEVAYTISKGVVWFLLIFVVLFKQNVGGRAALPGLNNPIWVSRLIGMLILILLYCRPLNFNLKIHYITLIVAFFLMIVFGSRMPMLSVILIFILIRNNVSSTSSNIFLLVILLIFIGFGFMILHNSYLFETSFYSVYQRIDIFKQLKNLDFNFIKGIGTGSYGIYFHGTDIESYPHNSFLELYVENGIIGLALYIYLIIAFYKAFTLNIVMLLCLYALLNSLTSGNIPGNNLFYVLLYFSFYTHRNTSINHYNL